MINRVSLTINFILCAIIDYMLPGYEKKAGLKQYVQLNHSNLFFLTQYMQHITYLDCTFEINNSCSSPTYHLSGLFKSYFSKVFKALHLKNSSYLDTLSKLASNKEAQSL